MPRPKKSSESEQKKKPGQKQSLPHQSQSESSTLTSFSSDSQQDSESSKPIDSLEEFSDTQNYDEADLYPDPEVIYILRGGILKRQDNWRMKKTDWHYRIFDTTGKVMLVNYDLHDAVPFTKAILNEVAEFPEIQILKSIQKIVIALVLISFALMFIGIRGVSQSDFEKGISKVTTVTQQSNAKAQPEQPNKSLLVPTKTNTGTTSIIN